MYWHTVNNRIILAKAEPIKPQMEVTLLHNRPDWDAYFIEITRIIATRSSCLHRQVGALLVRDHRILTTGYNGAPAGMRHCIELGGCLRDKMGFASGCGHDYCRALHAEQNAVIQAAVVGLSIKGATLYCTHSPCTLCAKILIASGITRIVFEGNYPDDLAFDLFKEAGLQVEQYHSTP